MNFSLISIFAVILVNDSDCLLDIFLTSLRNLCRSFVCVNSSPSKVMKLSVWSALNLSFTKLFTCSTTSFFYTCGALEF